MRSRRRLPLLSVLLILLLLALVFLWRRNTRAEFGPTTGLCPGPDQYGYTCESGAGFAYLDATIDTQLYEDDGATIVALPFPFVFYGTTYTSVHISSNGNLQFDGNNPKYFNDCMVNAPAEGMGDMIAPYWDDLDLRLHGFLETEVFGTTPERIFVVEWDSIPRFGDDSEDRVTFEVQLFERNHDIVFLYENVAISDGYNGSSATIGLQSEAQQLALQYGCDQPVVANASAIHFPHPAAPNRDIGREMVIGPTTSADAQSQAKGQVEELQEMLELWGPTILPRMRDQWLRASPARTIAWQWLDLIGDGRDELVVLWQGQRNHPEVNQLAVFASDRGRLTSLILEKMLSSRQEYWQRSALLEAADLTGDGLMDLPVGDVENGLMEVLSAGSGQIAMHRVPETCRGHIAFVDVDDNGILDIVRDGCESAGRHMAYWDRAGFQSLSSESTSP